MNDLKYVSITQKELTDIFLFLSSHGAKKEHIKQVNTLMGFLMEYNVSRAFTQTHEIQMVKGTKKLVKMAKPRHFWPCQNGSSNKFPWQSKIKSIKIREDHWLVNTEARMSMLGIKTAA